MTERIELLDKKELAYYLKVSIPTINKMIERRKLPGIIRLSDMKDDYYVLDEKNYKLVGQKKGKVYRLGDPIRIKVTVANLDRRTLDFIPA